MSFTKEQFASVENALDQKFAHTFLLQKGYTSDDDKFEITRTLDILAAEYYYFPEILTASTIVWGLLQLMTKELEKQQSVHDSYSPELEELSDQVEFISRLHFWIQAG